MLYPGNDDALHRLLVLGLLNLTSSSLRDKPQNLEADLQEPIMPQRNKEEMHKARESFLHRPTYYHSKVTKINYCGHWACVVRFYLHVCRFSPSWSKMEQDFE